MGPVGAARAAGDFLLDYDKDNNMIYVTRKRIAIPKQVTLEDILLDREIPEIKDIGTSTLTRVYPETPDELKHCFNIDLLIKWLNDFNERHADLFQRERNSMYYQFKIPKKTGGFRDIDAPVKELQSALTEVVNFLKNQCNILYHTAAFAYIEERSTVDCVRRHQKNNSNWFLKLDIKSFFPSTTLKYLMHISSMTYPLSEICKIQEGKAALERTFSLAFKDGKLPQGTTLSPLISNIVMLPIDFKVFNTLAARKIVYTRYCDDMIISAQEKFPWQEVVKIVKDAFTEMGAPYRINDEKTRFGSKKGSNFNLGLMLNGNNDITVGYKAKKRYKAALCSFIQDTIHGNRWPLEDVTHLNGLTSYYRYLEKEYFDQIWKRASEKWNVDIGALFKSYLST